MQRAQDDEYREEIASRYHCDAGLAGTPTLTWLIRDGTRSRRNGDVGEQDKVKRSQGRRCLPRLGEIKLWH